ncbi:MAG: patatin-like phospholipase family protein [Nocardioides sp.]|jgi:NTE family protein
MTSSALVLGGGGLTGIGWEAGLLKGLADRGIDLSTADTVVGTSAGSVVGTLIRSLPLDEVYDLQVAPADAELGAEFGPMTMLKLAPAVLLPGASRTKRKRIGSVALRAHPAGGKERVQIIRDRIKMTEWPEGELRITAVKADTGAFRVFTKDSGIDLVHAVAASCAVPLIWPAVSIADEPYIDGGMRSTANVDVASDATDVVVVIAPLPQAFSRSTRISTQLGRCKAERKVVITPDAQALAAFGKNVLDPAKRADAAREGLRQAEEVAEKVRAAWEG